MECSYSWAGKPDEAVKSLESALAIQQKLVEAESPRSPCFRASWRVTLDNIGYVQGGIGKQTESLQATRAGTGDRIQKLSDQNPTDNHPVPE